MADPAVALIMMTSTMSNEPRVAREARALTDNGVKVVALGICATGDEPRFERADGFDIRRFDLLDVRLVRAIKRRRPGRRFDSECSAAPGSDVAAPDRRTRPDLLGDLRNIVHWAVASVQFVVHGARSRASVLHAHDLPPLLAALVLGAVTRRPVVYESHEYWSAKFPAQPLSRFVGRRLERFGCRRAALVIAVNDAIADRMAEEFGIARPEVVLNVPDVEVQRALAPRAPGAPLEVLYHGIVARGRGIEQLVEAMALVRSPMRLVIRGPGELRPKIRSRIAELGLGERVHLEDPVPMSDLVVAASSAHVGVNPFERLLGYDISLPNKFFEYMAAGLALVSTDGVEIGRLVDELGNGLLVPEPTPQALAVALDRLADDVDELDRFRRRSLDAASRTYTWSTQRHRLIDAYLPLLRRSC